MKPGLFITFEGGEGGGKTTQSTLLYQALKEEGVPVIRTREPGGTEGAEQIRHLLVQNDAPLWEKMTELLLHFAARVEHVEKVIKPALAEGKTVICDRFTDSTLAYQGYGHGLGAEIIQMMRNISIGNFQPDITFILDIAPSAGIERANSRHGTDNRYEQMGLDFHLRVREGFQAIARDNPGRCVVLNAAEKIEVLHGMIRGMVGKYFEETIMFRYEMPRVFELIDLIENRDSYNSYFCDFENTAKKYPFKQKVWTDNEKIFQSLELKAWKVFKENIAKSLNTKTGIDVGGKNREWEHVIDTINEARGYNYLLSIGCSNINFISRIEGGKTPDLTAMLGNKDVFCEVKTINPSNDAIIARNENQASTTLAMLELDFFENKLKPTIEKAKEKIDKYIIKKEQLRDETIRIVYIVINFDDYLDECQDRYFSQITDYFSTNPIPDLKIVFYVRPPYYYASSVSEGEPRHICL